MTDYIRRLVSGDKARFHDDELNLELGLPSFSPHHVIVATPLYRDLQQT